jgi:predicted ATPase
VLLGRSRELEALDRMLGDVRSVRGRGVLVTGDAGIGKTALHDRAGSPPAAQAS